LRPTEAAQREESIDEEIARLDREAEGIRATVAAERGDANGYRGSSPRRQDH
jgi:hypothetical protein